MSVYYIDQIKLTSITLNENFRTETKGTPFYSEAYVEEDDKIIFDSTGQPIKPIKRIFVPYKGANKNIKEGDLIQVTKRFKMNVVEEEVKIKAAPVIGGFSGDHLEIIV